MNCYWRLVRPMNGYKAGSIFILHRIDMTGWVMRDPSWNYSHWKDVSVFVAASSK